MKNDVMKRKKEVHSLSRITYVLTFSIFALWMLCSNAIMLTFAKNPPVIIADMPKKMSMVHFWVDGAETNNSIFEDAYFSGWAFCGTVNNNDERFVNLLLQKCNGKTVYEVPAIIYERTDVARALPNSGAMGTRHGFTAEFTTLNVANGDYNVLIHCHENDSAYGVVDTGYTLIKHNRITKIERRKASEVELDMANVLTDAKTYIDRNHVNTDGSAEIVGWGFVPGQGTTGQTVYVRFAYGDGSSVVYEAVGAERSDVAQAFSSDLYAFSGFSALIPAELLHSTDYTITVLIENETGLHMMDTNGYLENSSGKANGNGIDINAVQKDANSYIDTNQIAEDGSLTVAGWAYVPNRNAADQKVYVLLTYDDGSSAVHEASKVERHDVASYFSDNKYKMSGFQMILPAEQVRNAGYTVSVLVEDENGLHMK